MCRRRVLIGPSDAAGVAGTMSRALRRRGHRTALVLFAAPPFGRSHGVVRRGRVGRFAAAAAAPLRFDVLHLQGGQSFVAGLLDARWAAMWGRLVVMHFWGSDCRQEAVMRRLHPASARQLALSDDARAAARRAARTVPAAGRVCAAALVSDLELASYVVPHFLATYVVPTPLELPLRPATLGPLPGKGPVVLHAPSDQNLKGSAEIERTLEQLAGEMPVRPRVLGGIPHSELLAEIARADVVVDQLHSETTGVLALEAMAIGKPLLSAFDRGKLAPFARGTPAVQVSPATLLDRLREVCADSRLRVEVGRRGPEFVASVHDSDAVAALWGDVYEHVRRNSTGLFEVRPGGIAPLELDL